MRAAFTLTPTESNRFLAKAVAGMEQVQKALANAYLILAPGTTNGYVAQEVLGMKDLRPENYAIGLNTHRLLCITDPEKREHIPIVAYKGELVEKNARQALDDFHLDTVIVKGANAVDPFGIAGSLQTNPKGGSWGDALGLIGARGFHCIVPVGVEKSTPLCMRAAP